MSDRQVVPKVTIGTEAWFNQELPTHLLAKGAARVQWVAVVGAAMFGTSLVVWALAVLYGTATLDLQSGMVSGGRVLMLGLSLVLWSVARAPSVPPAQKLDLGLAYHFLVSLFIAQRELTALALREDALIGISSLCVWALVYPVLVPSDRRRTMVVVVGISLLEPVLALALMGLGLSFQPGTLVVWFLPIAVVSGLAWMSSEVLHGLGREVSQARRLGSYTLSKKIGQGGFGEVWRAEHALLKRPAAVKLIRYRENESRSRQAVALRRFEREAMATAQLVNPNSVQIYDYGSTEDGTFYLAMELLDGIDLHHVVKKHGTLSPARVIHVLMGACSSLGEAHRRGILHRDITPSNIFLCRMGGEFDLVKVLDFGLVKRVSTRDSGADSISLTGEGTAMGTPGFMAPETIRADPSLDHRVDLYALGAVAWWMLCGKRVLERKTPMKTLIAHANEAPPPIQQMATDPVPDDLAAVIMGLLCKDPNDRVANARALQAQLMACEDYGRWGRVEAEAWWADKDIGAGSP